MIEYTIKTAPSANEICEVQDEMKKEKWEVVTYTIQPDNSVSILFSKQHPDKGKKKILAWG